MNKAVIYVIVGFLMISSALAVSKSDFVQMIENTNHCFDCHTIYKITKAADTPITKLNVNYYDLNRAVEKETLNDEELLVDKEILNENDRFTFSLEKYEIYTEEIPVYEPCMKEITRIINNDTGETETEIINSCLVRKDTIEKQRPFYQEISPDELRVIYNDAKIGDSFYVKVSGQLKLGETVDNVLTVGDYIYYEYAIWNATGGSKYYDGAYTVHVFTSNGTFNVTGTINASVLIIAGGGGSTYSGGGAGGFIETNLTIPPGSYNVTVGRGGLGKIVYPVANATQGGNSAFYNQTAIGGGGAPGSGLYPSSINGGSGAGVNLIIANGGNGTPGQGYNGGGEAVSNSWAYAGGGGASSVGKDGCGTATCNVSGDAGMGRNSTINGSLVCYAGGGGGGGYRVSYAGAAVCGGGAGSSGSGYGDGGKRGVNGTDGTGGGAGGCGDGSSGYCTGGNGGSGIVIIRYLTYINTIANESEARASILAGIASSEIASSYSAYPDKQFYIRLLNGSQYKDTFDSFVVSGDAYKRWAFNYNQSSSSSFPSPFFNVTPVFYVWQGFNMNYDQIMWNVSQFINDTYP